MEVKVFSLRWGECGFDDAPMQAWLDGRPALHVWEHLISRDGQPVWCLLVGAPERAQPSRPARPEGERTEVSPGAQPLFEALWRWRNDRARRDGRPAYVLFHNTTLAAIAEAAPTNREALGGVPGVGEARLRDYGEEVLGKR